MWQFWLIMSGFFLIVEIATVGFLIFWLSIASLIAMIVSFFTDNIIIQTTVFVVSSALLILFTKPFINKFVNKKTIPTNINSLKNKTALVTIEINNILGTGQIKLNGETWSAKSNDENIIIPVNSEVEILNISGVKAIVTPKVTINN